MCYGFQKTKKKHIGKIQDGLAFIGVNIAYPNNIVLLINVDKFDPNPILVKINKSRP
jgi:hypothetical protein